MRLLAEWFPEVAEKFEQIDERTYPFPCFTLAIRNRSRSCLLKHFQRALEVGATRRRAGLHYDAHFPWERAGGDDCWTHDTLGDGKALIAGSIQCCPKSVPRQMTGDP